LSPAATPGAPEAKPAENLGRDIVTILNESGIPNVTSPLRGLAGLAERLPDALFIVAGTRADAHLTQALSSPLPGTPSDPSYNGFGMHPRIMFAVLEPDEEPDGGALASNVLKAVGSEPAGLVLLVACRSVGLLGVDASFEATLVERRLDLPVRAMVFDTGDLGVLSTDLEDGAIQTLIGLCPEDVLEEERSHSKGSLFDKLPFRNRPGGQTAPLSSTPAGRRSAVVLLGALPGPQIELADELERVGVEVAGAVPDAEWLPTIGEETIVAIADPYLVRSCRAAEERGAMVVKTLLPIGVEGTARFVQDVAASAGRGTREASHQVRQVWEGLEPLRNRIRGKRIFFTGDTGLEVPLARFLANAGAVVLEVGTPRLDKRFLAAELSALGEDVDVVESPEWRAQLERIDAARPDLVVASPGLYAPLVARGHLCRSSLDLLSLGIHGYQGARRVLELFARTFERAERLDTLNL
jgi:light-independent protochlorophyllide reductase subunit N